MGPRGCSYFHFISVIRGSEVIKTPNISRGKKAPKFKKIEQIYASIDSQCDNSHEKCPPKVDRALNTLYGCDEVKIEVKIEPTEDNGPDSDSMTLKQLKRTCNSKKRKISSSVNSTGVKQEYIDSQPQEDELDLKETLTSWKSKVLKKTKTKKGINSLSSTANSSGRGSKCSPYDQPQEENSWKICQPTIIKVEYPQFYGSQHQAITYFLPDNIHQYIETSLRGFESVSLSGSSDEDLPCPVSSLTESQSCGLNEASYGHLGSDLSGASHEHLSFSVSSPLEAQSSGFDQVVCELLESDPPLISANLKSDDVEKVNDTLVTVDQSLDFVVLEQRKDEGMNCGFGQAAYEHLGSDLPMNPLVFADMKNEDVEKVNNTFVKVEQSLDFPVVEHRKEEDMAGVMVYDKAIQAQNCVLSHVSYEQLQCVQFQVPIISEDSKSKDAVGVDCEAGSGVKSLASSVLEHKCDEWMSVPMTCVEAAVQAQKCVLSEVSYKHLECVQLQSQLMSADSKIENAIEVDGEAGSGDNFLVSSVSEEGCEVGMRVPMTFVETAGQAQNFVLRPVSYEHLKGVQLQNPLSSEDSKTENATVIDDETFSPVSDYLCEEGISVLLTCDETPETVFLGCNKTDFKGYNLHDQCVHAPMPDPDSLCVTTKSTDEDKAIIDNSKDIKVEVTELVRDEQSSTSEYISTLPLVKKMVSRGNVASVHSKQSSIHDVASTSLIFPPKETNSSVSERCLDDMPHPPERLFSARKTISPISQEKLCRVMNSLQMQADTDIHPCREKLSFEKDHDDKFSSTKSYIRKGQISFTSKMHEATSNTDVKPPMKKRKDRKNGYRFRGIPKSPHASHGSPNSSSRCCSIKSCSQNAIVFSQQQMTDIKRLAQKLVTELHSMRDIFVDALQCESRRSAKLRYNTDKVREAVENATKVEGTTRKWLSMMTKDCNRFCKIMRLAEANDESCSSPEKAENHNKRRKITFADEAGGSLCHVRVFEASEASGFALSVKPEIKEEIL